MKLIITLQRDADGVWMVECPPIPGCVTQGKKRPALKSRSESMPCRRGFAHSHRCRQMFDLGAQTADFLQRSFGKDGELAWLAWEEFAAQGDEGGIHPLQLF
jgi:hypothetical protein